MVARMACPRQAESAREGRCHQRAYAQSHAPSPRERTRGATCAGALWLCSRSSPKASRLPRCDLSFRQELRRYVPGDAALGAGAAGEVGKICGSSAVKERSMMPTSVTTLEGDVMAWYEIINAKSDSFVADRDAEDLLRHFAAAFAFR